MKKFIVYLLFLMGLLGANCFADTNYTSSQVLNQVLYDNTLGVNISTNNYTTSQALNVVLSTTTSALNVHIDSNSVVNIASATISQIYSNDIDVTYGITSATATIGGITFSDLLVSTGTLQSDIDALEISTGTLVLRAGDTMTGTLNGTDISMTYGVSAATGVFSGAIEADIVNAPKVNIDANGYISFAGTSYGLLHANSSKEQLELTLTAANLGKQLVMGDRSSYTLDFDHVPQENPTFYIHSSTSVDYDNSQWVSLAHDKSDAIFGIGKGSFSFIGGSVDCQYGIIASSSTITKVINPVSSVQILWSTSSINCDNYNTLVVSSGSIVSVSTITAGVEGQEIKLTGTSDTDIVRFITGGNLKLDIGGSFDAGNADKMWFTYRDLYWEEDNRKNNTF